MKTKTTTEKVPKLTPEARDAIALAFEGMGGLKKLIAWAKSHQAVFYTQLYSKLIPMQLQGQVSVEVDISAAAAIEHTLNALIEQRKEDASSITNMMRDANGPIIDVTPNPREPIDDATVVRPSFSRAADVAPTNRAPPSPADVNNSTPAIPIAEGKELSTTERFLLWGGSTGGGRISPRDWGNI